MTEQEFLRDRVRAAMSRLLDQGILDGATFNTSPDWWANNFETATALPHLGYFLTDLHRTVFFREPIGWSINNADDAIDLFRQHDIRLLLDGETAWIDPTGTIGHAYGQLLQHLARRFRTVNWGWRLNRAARSHNDLLIVFIGDYNVMNRRELAQEILNRHHGISVSGRRLYLRAPFTNDPQPVPLYRSSLANIQDTANGLMARTRPNDHTNTSSVHLSEDLLRAILRLSDWHGNILVNTIAGAHHRGPHYREEHIRGMAADFSINQHWHNHYLGGGTPINPVAALNYLEGTWGFRTQRNRGPNDIGYAGPDYTGAGHFHLSVFGRNF